MVKHINTTLNSDTTVWYACILQHSILLFAVVIFFSLLLPQMSLKHFSLIKHNVLQEPFMRKMTKRNIVYTHLYL